MSFLIVNIYDICFSIAKLLYLTILEPYIHLIVFLNAIYNSNMQSVFVAWWMEMEVFALSENAWMSVYCI